MQLYPRFPILGGWKSNFNIGYNLPTKFHVNTDGIENYSLNLTFGLPFVDIVAKNYTMKIVLPEGASDINVSRMSLNLFRSIFLLMENTTSPTKKLSPIWISGEELRVLFL